MAVAARQQEAYAAPRTKVYSYAEPAVRPERRKEERATHPEAGRAAAPHPHGNPSVGRMIASVLAVGALMAVFLFVVARYEVIAERNAEINDLRVSIAASKKVIAELDVRLQCAVDVDAARAAAREAGMQYPDSGQIVDVG